jgi:hypothetical protein
MAPKKIAEAQSSTSQSVPAIVAAVEAPDVEADDEPEIGCSWRLNAAPVWMVGP